MRGEAQTTDISTAILRGLYNLEGFLLFESMLDFQALHAGAVLALGDMVAAGHVWIMKNAIQCVEGGQTGLTGSINDVGPRSLPSYMFPNQTPFVPSWEDWEPSSQGSGPSSSHAYTLNLQKDLSDKDLRRLLSDRRSLTDLAALPLLSLGWLLVNGPGGTGKIDAYGRLYSGSEVQIRETEGRHART